jgi:hypothetical protein
VLPPSERGTRLGDDEVSDVDHDGRAFDGGEEPAGREQPLLGVAPAQQAFEGRETPGAETPDRLIVQLELVGGEATLDVERDTTAFGNLVGEVPIEDHGLARAGQRAPAGRLSEPVDQLGRIESTIEGRLTDGEPNVGTAVPARQRRVGQGEKAAGEFVAI